MSSGLSIPPQAGIWFCARHRGDESAIRSPLPWRAHAGPQARFDLRAVSAQRARALHRRGGARQEPDAGLGRMLKPEDIEALWAYVVSAESIYGH